MHVTCAPLFRLVALVTASALLGSGCTSMHPVAVVAPGQPQATTTVNAGEATTPVKAGDNVRVTMRDGRTAQFTVEQVEVSAITARGGEKYATDEILTLERRSVSAAKTSVLIVSVVGAVGVVLLILYAVGTASLAGNFGSSRSGPD